MMIGPVVILEENKISIMCIIYKVYTYSIVLSPPPNFTQNNDFLSKLWNEKFVLLHY